MTRSIPLLGVVAILLLEGGLVNGRVASKSDRPNILLIMVDDLGWADVGYRKGSPYHTPHLDRLASQGMRFPNAYASQCVCSPRSASAIIN